MSILTRWSEVRAAAEASGQPIFSTIAAGYTQLELADKVMTTKADTITEADISSDEQVEDPTSYTRFLFYGSLRPDLYNYRRLIAPRLDNCKVVKNVIVNDIKLYDTSYGYPVAFQTKDKASCICTLFELNDEYVKSYIHLMEVGAGYGAYLNKEHNAIIYLGSARGFVGTKLARIDGNPVDWVNFKQH